MIQYSSQQLIAIYVYVRILDRPFSALDLSYFRNLARCDICPNIYVDQEQINLGYICSGTSFNERFTSSQQYPTPD